MVRGGALPPTLQQQPTCASVMGWKGARGGPTLTPLSSRMWREMTSGRPPYLWGGGAAAVGTRLCCRQTRLWLHSLTAPPHLASCIMLTTVQDRPCSACAVAMSPLKKAARSRW